ncbi:hypothetical protein K435DRAFT_797327 [Dendrothele bispora CBS 962.96]|uniref:Protein kinase domain-containing protein n=1 Tax=Dendrothele bispora (strain CBS 962.96) TaxID=1314807 RepID=A0A4S8M2V2_DENBC|nr:hypothetical protein K435DRAFT_797327 [Dendrothele bispora CBS 962.96]
MIKKVNSVKERVINFVEPEENTLVWSHTRTRAYYDNAFLVTSVIRNYTSGKRNTLQTAHDLYLCFEPLPEIIHLDLKPKNLIFRRPAENADILMADFGRSRIMEEEKLSLLTEICGTPGYMAPEIFEKKSIDEMVGTVQDTCSFVVSDEEMGDFCCVVVGNKLDLAQKGSQIGNGSAIGINGHVNGLRKKPINCSLNPLNLRPRRQSQSNTNSPSSPSFSRAAMITRSKSRTNSSRSRSPNSRVYSGVGGGGGGTMTTMNSGFSIYHTPSSSVYDQFESARTSPEPWPEQLSSISSSPASASGSGSSGSRPPRRRILSAGNRSTLSIDSLQTRSTSSVATVTTSLYAREHDEDNDDWDHEATVASSAASFFSALSGSFSYRTTAPDSSRDTDRTAGGVPPPITPPDCGPRLFMRSAKTGEGVKDVFEYIAKRVVTRWEWEERQEAARFEFGEGGGDGTWSSRNRGRGGSWGRKTGQGIKLGARTESGRGRGRGGMVNGNGNGSWSASGLFYVRTGTAFGPWV